MCSEPKTPTDGASTSQGTAKIADKAPALVETTGLDICIHQAGLFWAQASRKAAERVDEITALLAADYGHRHHVSKHHTGFIGGSPF